MCQDQRSFTEGFRSSCGRLRAKATEGRAGDRSAQRCSTSKSHRIESNHTHLIQDQKTTLLKLSDQLPSLRSHLSAEIKSLDQKCLEAKVEENDYTVLTYDDLEFELELAEAGIRKKIAFVENQVGNVRLQVGSEKGADQRSWYLHHIPI